MTDGQLRVRITAWEREQAWAPPHADTALKTAYLDTYQAERDAQLTHAAKQAADADATMPDANSAPARAAAVSRAIQETARVRAEWAAETAATRAAAERADAEAARRGLVIGHEPDRVTAEELLAADRAARYADDDHRVITDTDVIDPAAGDARDLFIADDRSPSLDHPGPATVEAAARDAAEQAAQAQAAQDANTAQAGAATAVDDATAKVGARAVLDARPSPAELAGAVTAAHAAAAVIADRRSQEASVDIDHAAVELPDPATAGRSRERDRDRAATNGTEAAAGQGAFDDAGL
jgi:hypothetical protein